MATIALSRTCSAIDLFQLFLMGTLKVPQRIICHNKRQPISSLSIELSLENKLLCKKPVYLSNPSNKQAFVNALAKSLQDAGHEVVQSPDDADLEQLFKLAHHEVGSGDTILVGDDTDLLLLLIHYFKSELQNTEKQSVHVPTIFK